MLRLLVVADLSGLQCLADWFLAAHVAAHQPSSFMVDILLTLPPMHACLPCLLCSPAGGLLFEFAGGASSAAELRELLKKPEQLVQHTGHMQQLMSMVEAAKRLLSSHAAASAAAATSLLPAAPPAIPAATAAGGTTQVIARQGSAFNLVAPQQQLPAVVVSPPSTQGQGTGKRGGGRKRRGGSCYCCLVALGACNDTCIPYSA